MTTLSGVWLSGRNFDMVGKFWVGQTYKHLALYAGHFGMDWQCIKDLGALGTSAQSSKILNMSTIQLTSSSFSATQVWFRKKNYFHFGKN